MWFRFGGLVTFLLGQGALIISYILCLLPLNIYFFNWSNMCGCGLPPLFALRGACTPPPPRKNNRAKEGEFLARASADMAAGGE
jgi:hypothetical protein